MAAYSHGYLGGHKVTSLDDVLRYSDSINFHTLSIGDGRAEAKEIQQGLKSEAEIQAYTLDEQLVGLDRLRFFLFNKNATALQRQVGLDSLLREICTPAPLDTPSVATCDCTGACCCSAPHRSVAAAQAFATDSCITEPARSAPCRPHTLTEAGDRILDAILPDLHKACLASWDWELQTKVAAIYTQLIEARVMQRARLETVVAPFLMRVLEGSTHGAGGVGPPTEEEYSEEVLAVWLQPFLACLDALAVCTPLMPSPPGASPTKPSAQAAALALSKPSAMLAGAILDFSLKKGTQYLLSQPISVRVLCVQVWGHLARHLDPTVLRERVLEPALAMCQDTSAAVRKNMCRHLIDLILALSPSAASTSTSSSSSPAASSDPLLLLLVELEELLKDEEKLVKAQAFQTLVASLPRFPPALRRARAVPMLRNLVQLPPKGMLLLIAQHFGAVLLALKADLLPLPDSASSSSSGAQDAAQIAQLVKPLLAFFKNLPFLSSSAAPELNSSQPLSPGPTLSFAAAATAAANAAAAAAEPRRYCASNFVAVLSILGRASTGGPTSPTTGVPEARFFLDHVGGLFHKLLSDPDTDTRILMCSSFFEVLHTLAGLGSSLTSTALPQHARCPQGLGPTSPFKLTKDAFLTLLHEAAPPAATAASASSAAAPRQTSSPSPSVPSSASGPSPAFIALPYLLEGGKLEAIVSVYYACHFGAGPSSNSAPPTEAALDSWSAFMQDLIRSLLQYEAALCAHTHQWRTKLAFWQSVQFLLAPRPTATSSSFTSSAGPALPRGHFFGSILGLRSLGDLHNYALAWERTLSLACGHMHTSAAPLKAAASRTLVSFMLTSPFALRRAEAVQRFVREFAASRSYADRMVFVEVARLLLGANDGSSSSPGSPSPKLLSNRLFKKLVFLPLVSLCGDAVSNVRRSLARGSLLALVRRTLGPSSSSSGCDGPLHEAWSRALTAIRSQPDAEWTELPAPRALTSSEETTERALEEAEDSLLRGEEAWLLDERHKAALAMAGGNVSLASAALQAAANYAPISDKPSVAGGGPGDKNSNLKPKRVSQGAASLKALQEAVEASSSLTVPGALIAAGRRKSFNPEAMAALSANVKASSPGVGTTSINAASAAAQASQAAALAASRVAAATKIKLKGNGVVSATSSGTATPSTAALPPSGHGLAVPKAIRRYGSTPSSGYGVQPPAANGTTSASATTATKSTTSSTAARPPVQPSNGPTSASAAATMASILATKNQARSTVEALLKGVGNASAPSPSSSPGTTPSPSFGPTAAPPLGTRPNRGALDFPQREREREHASSAEADEPSSSLGARARPAAVAVRSSKLLSANLSLSAARIGHSPGGSSPAGSPTGSGPASSPLGGARSALSSGSALGLGHANLLGRAASPLLGRPRPVRATGSTSDRSGEREPGASQQQSILSSMHGHSASFSGSAGALATAVPSAVVNSAVPPSGSSALSLNVDSQSGAPAAGRRAVRSANSLSSGGNVVLPKLDSPSSASTKLYSKEPPAHAHMRKFKLSQRGALPTAELLRSESCSLAVGPGAKAAAAAADDGAAMLNHVRRRSTSQGGSGGSFGPTLTTIQAHAPGRASPGVR